MPLQTIDKILIANRGEIACRIIRACRDMGVATVAVFSQADANALHVRMADESIAIGPAPAKESYLRADKILAAAAQSGAHAIHPGYGFLSENADFARACEQAGVIFIGPPAEAIDAMGGKTSARTLMQAAGVPTVPGNNGPQGQGLPDVPSALAAASDIGYPVMLKAAAGGGGRGMRIINDEKALPAAFESAKREAGAAFGNDAVYLEKAITSARHIEVQIFADTHGNVVHLFERDCSVQRRNQKVIEEAPSPAIDQATRDKMGAMAVQAARSVGYVSAGTVEMLYDAHSRDFYFLEMNTRLQVEHPVTELITGVDLVRWQILVARGQALPLKQEQITMRGAAIECRIYAEDPVGFLPAPGTIAHLETPSGPGVRDDSGITQGSTIPVHYDPMISKLCTWGQDRPEAIERMRRALREYRVVGIKTNLAFHHKALAHPAFVSGDIDTSFIQTHKDALLPDAPSHAEKRAIAITAAVAFAERSSPANATPGPSHQDEPSAWRRALRPS